ncbi:unnamed protein product [Ectocarpus sp. 13 AM-2016]
MKSRVGFVLRVSPTPLGQDVTLECLSDINFARVYLSRPCFPFSSCWSVAMHKGNSLAIVVSELLRTSLGFTALFRNSTNDLQPYFNDALFSAEIVPRKKHGGPPKRPRPPATH